LLPTLTLVFVILALAASVALPLLLHRRLLRSLAAEKDKMLKNLEEKAGAGAKFLEVRRYYDFMSREIGRLLDEAHRDRNRSRIEQLRVMRERLLTLKARVLDSTVSGLNNAGDDRKKNRRRRRRPRRKPSPKTTGNAQSTKSAGNSKVPKDPHGSADSPESRE